MSELRVDSTSNIKIFNTTSSKPDYAAKEFQRKIKAWKENMKAKNKLVSIESTDTAGNSSGWIMTVIYSVCHIYKKEILLEKIKKKKVKVDVHNAEVTNINDIIDAMIGGNLFEDEDNMERHINQLIDEAGRNRRIRERRRRERRLGFPNVDDLFNI